jgi:hypothetical protein
MEWTPLASPHSLKRNAESQLQPPDSKKHKIEKIARKRLCEDTVTQDIPLQPTKKIKIKQAAQKRPREEGEAIISAKRMRIQRIKRAGEVLENVATKKARHDDIPVNYAGIILRDVTQKLNTPTPKKVITRPTQTAQQLGRQLGILSLPKRARDETKEKGPVKKRARVDEIDTLTKNLSSLTISRL